MKPLNSHTAGCDPVSSNCVIWQGPDIPCLKLCKGDTVSDVVHKLATELCDLLTALDVTTYTLPSPCFANQACTPQDFHDLIQIIINKICDLEDCCNQNGQRVSGTTEGCPDCVVEIASCFYYTNEFGDQVTTMQLADYTRAIGNKLCDLVNQITSLNAAVSDLDLRVTALENAPAPTLVLPQVTPVCVLSPSVPTNMNLVLSTLEQQFCQLVSVTGSPNAMSQALTKQCLNLSSSPALGPGGGTMATIPGWIISANTVASSLNNMWLTLCDLRAAVRTIQLTCCPSGCDGIDFVLQASFTGTALTLYFTGTIPPGFQECDPLGNTFKISDTLGNSITTKIITTNYFNDPIGYGINLAVTPLNPASDLTVTSDICFTDPSTNTTCQFCVTAVVTNQSICPTVSAVSNLGGTEVVISFSPVAIPGSYTVELWDAAFSGILDSQTQYLTTYSSTNYTFTGLAPSTVYNARVVITVGANTTECGYVTFTTNPVLCLPPTGLSAAIELPVLCDTCGTALEFSDNPTVDGTYVDVSSDYLLTYSGGSFGNLIQVTSDEAINGTIRQPISFGGRTWVVTSDTEIKVYSDAETGTPVLDTTITPGVAGIVNMIYDTDLDLVFFVYNDLATGFRRLGTIDPTAYTVTLNVGPAFSAGANQAQELYFNPVTFEKYVRVGDGDIYVLSAGATGLTLQATLTAVGAAALRYVTFDSVSGNAWIATSDATNTEEILVVNGTTYATITTLNTSVAGMQPYVGNTNTNAMTFYSNGTSSTVYVIYRSTVANYNYMIIAYNASTYAETTFLNEGATDLTPLPRQIFYSTVFGKVVYTKSTTVDMYDPSTSTVDYSPTITLADSALRIHEDTVNSLLVFSTNVASPTNNLFWYEVDPSNAVQCTEGIVDLYIGNAGPYQFNTTTSSWDAMCTSSVSVVGTTITANATLSASVTFAALLYSTDYGLTWSPLADNGGNLYANPAAWLAGRTFTKPAGAVQAKVSFSTNDDCGLEGVVMNL